MEPVISLQNVSFRYKLRGNIFHRSSYNDVLKLINLDIYPGETLGIIGRNGSGKSTLMNLICGMLRPSSGQLVNRNVSVSLLSLRAGFDNNLSGRDNSIFVGMAHGYSRLDVESRLDEIQEYSELGKFFYDPVRIYSSGMRARLGFSIANILSHDVLLIDEILSVGDIHFKKKSEKTILSKIQSNQTVVLVSHSYAQISNLCERVVLIDNGKIIGIGAPQRLLLQYQELLTKKLGQH